MPLDVLEDAIVGGRLAPLVVLRLETVDGYHHLQARDRRPLDWDRPDRAGDHLRVDASLGQLGQDLVELSKPDERFTADDRDVNGPVVIDELHEIIDEFLAFVVADLAQRDAAAEVFVAVCVTTWAAQGALAGDFD